MEVLIILVPLSLLILGIAIGFLFSMIGTGQLDENDSAAWRVLTDNDNPENTDTVVRQIDTRTTPESPGFD